MAGDILGVQPPFLFSPEQPILVNATTLTAEEEGLAAVAGSAARRGPGYMTGVCLVLYAAAAASLGNVVQVVLRTVLYFTVLYCTVLYCTVVQVVLMRTNPEVTNNHLIVCLGEDTPLL